MKLQSIKIIEYKGIENVEVPLDKPILPIMGTNGIGKTRVMQAIKYTLDILNSFIKHPPGFHKVGSKFQYMKSGENDSIRSDLYITNDNNSSCIKCNYQTNINEDSGRVEIKEYDISINEKSMPDYSKEDQYKQFQNELHNLIKDITITYIPVGNLNTLQATIYNSANYDIQDLMDRLKKIDKDNFPKDNICYSEKFYKNQLKVLQQTLTYAIRKKNDVGEDIILDGEPLMSSTLFQYLYKQACGQTMELREALSINNLSIDGRDCSFEVIELDYYKSIFMNPSHVDKINKKFFRDYGLEYSKNIQFIPALLDKYFSNNDINKNDIEKSWRKKVGEMEDKITEYINDNIFFSKDFCNVINM